jgi:hypothetical protein
MDCANRISSFWTGCRIGAAGTGTLILIVT